MYDLIIQNGLLVDGTGNDAYVADIAVKDGVIARIGRELTDAARIIDATGLVVTPGFIDSHSHSDKAIVPYPLQKEKLEQGITTCVAGQCGDSRAPNLDGESGEIYTMGQFLRKAYGIPQGCNVLTFVGHKCLRMTVMGNENRAPTEAEYQKMEQLLIDALDSGAIGISFGLMYNPSCYAETEELIRLSRCAKVHGGMVSAHIRNEGDFVEEAVEEFIRILKESGARGVYSHHKACGKANHGKVRNTMAMLEQAVNEGVEIWCDAYPYTASSTSLASAFVDKANRAGPEEQLTAVLNDPEKRGQIIAANTARWGDDLSFVLVTVCSAFPEYNGLRIPQIAQLRGSSQHDTALDIVRDSRKRNSACFFSMCEDDVKFVLAHPRTMICTDSSVAGTATHYHPRLRGSFPRAIGRYVRDEGIVSLPEMIRKMTSLPAQVYGLEGKGLLREGYDADICVFDYAAICDRADFTACSLPCEGLSWVLVGGQVAAENGVATGVRNGRVLPANR